MKMLTIALVGIITVFSVFVILYIVFSLFGFFSKKAQLKLPKKIESREKKHVSQEFTIQSDEEEIAAIAAAIYMMLGENVKILSIKRVKSKKREWISWKKTGWRGVKGWLESSKLE